ncbi:MAG: hypothetical protein E7020_05110 [Alphaproteobacteria bacterium]|nr:hypothetical protein [Alphaproteobacteria bacterium]
MADNDFSSDDFDKLLDDFIASQLEDTERFFTETSKPTTESNTNPTTENEAASLSNIIADVVDIDAEKLPLEEKRLYGAICELTKSAKACGDEAGIEYSDFILQAQHLLPRFRPSQMNIINRDIINAWEILIAAQPVRLSSLPPNASDEQILNFAEKTTDKNLQMALISYVESLIELDACEIAYNLRRVKYEKHKIEKKLYEEQQHRRDQMRNYIAAIKERNFPVDAEMLVNNFFKTVRKDPEGAKKMLENNPATFAPIQIDKIPSRFFGMIKAKPEDGIKINKRLGKFLKNLKA